MILSDRACVLKDGTTVNAAPIHVAFLKHLVVDSLWLATVVNSLLFHHAFGLRFVDGNETSRRELVVS